MIKGSLKDFSLPQEKLSAIYRGVVEDNVDPLLAGRCRVRIFGVHSQSKTKSATDGIPTVELPWAEPALPVMEGAVSKNGFFSVPLVNSHVFVFFENGNILKPIYFAAAPAISGGVPDWSSGGGTYPHNTVLQFHGGHYVEFDSTSGAERIKIYHKTGTLTSIDKDGNIQVTGVKNETINIAKDVTQTVGGNESDTVTGTWTITVTGAATINATGNATVKSSGSVTVESPSSVAIGSTAAKKKLLNQDAATVYNSHTHPGGGGPSPQMDTTKMTSVTGAN